MIRPSPSFSRFLPVLLLSVLGTMASAAVVVPPAQDLPPFPPQHPRLFLDAAAWEKLQTALAGPRHGEQKAFLKQVDAVLALRVPEGSAADGSDLRQAGNHLATLAFAWRLTGEERYLSAASAWATMICQRSLWGTDPLTKQPAEKGLLFGHLLLGLAMVHDYAGERLPPEVNILVLDTLRKRGGSAARALARGTWDEGHALLSNHTWVYATGVMAAGLALVDEDPEVVKGWVAQAVAILAASDALLAPDGSIQEGPGYWQYGVEYLVKLTELAKAVGITVHQGPWWQHAADYPLYLSLPHEAWTPTSSLVDLSDAARGNWYGPDYLLRWFARRNQDRSAQWLADATEAAGITTPSAPWLGLLSRDPSVPSVAPVSRPTLHHFTDLGLVSARSDWSGRAALVVAKTGQSLGDHALTVHPDWVDKGEMYHVHRDANDFSLFGAGAWLLRNPGYGRREARLHNTLTVDGQGQLGDPGQPEAWPLVLDHPGLGVEQVTAGATVDRIVLQAAGAYAPALGIRTFRRELIFFKPSALVVVDDIAADQPQTFELWFHPEHPLAPVGPGRLESNGPLATLRMDLLDPATAVACLRQKLAGRHFAAQEQELPAVKVSRRAATWRSVCAFSWAPRGTAPMPVAITKQADGLHLSWGSSQALVPHAAP
jgi:hypothetical protein